jgi:hypothetical protein
VLLSEKNAKHASSEFSRKVDGELRNDWIIPRGPERPVPMMTATNIHYEYADRVRGLCAGGIGAIFQMVQRIELVKEIDRDLQLLKRHLPYHESDHLLNIASNILTGGQRVEHLELRRNDDVYLDALGAKRIPDPTTAGDFCRRFSESDVITLIDIFNRVRIRVCPLRLGGCHQLLEGLLLQLPDALADYAKLRAHLSEGHRSVRGEPESHPDHLG